MTTDRVFTCACCGAEVKPEVPEYFIELECYRIISERAGHMPRRGSLDYHEAMEKLSPEIREAYFQNIEMYNDGHLWCPTCGGRLSGPEKIRDI